MLKAWWCFNDDDWGMYIHAETQSKAKQAFKQQFPGLPGELEWTDIRAQRRPALDGKAFTDANFVAAGLDNVTEYLEDWYLEDWYPGSWLEWCTCTLCANVPAQDEIPGETLRQAMERSFGIQITDDRQAILDMLSTTIHPRRK